MSALVILQENILKENSYFDINLENILHITCCAIKILVSVRNKVTKSATLAGMELSESRKLMKETITIAMQGR